MYNPVLCVSCFPTDLLQSLLFNLYLASYICQAEFRANEVYSLLSITIEHLAMFMLQCTCRIGRLQVNLVTRLVDIVLLCAMAWVPAGSDYHREVLVALHLCRTAFANCGRPLMKSLMMDNVPSRHRGKFNALDSVMTFSWSGSAAAGG